MGGGPELRMSADCLGDFLVGSDVGAGSYLYSAASGRRRCKVPVQLRPAPEGR
jgi:hypothetical protein